MLENLKTRGNKKKEPDENNEKQNLRIKEVSGSDDLPPVRGGRQHSGTDGKTRGKPSPKQKINNNKWNLKKSKMADECGERKKRKKMRRFGRMLRDKREYLNLLRPEKGSLRNWVRVHFKLDETNLN
ncbi:hypothetical protein RUM43_011805 [Polyplax serrata]|uniref:Uncharacterized protein n=1 Tax=Polyplax serrata TaxID=468196 RepID=A0AAN8PIZ0_POLSC